MIEYEYNKNKERWEFLFLTKDRSKVSLGYLDPKMPEEDRMKHLVKWFNACLKQLNEETPPSQ